MRLAIPILVRYSEERMRGETNAPFDLKVSPEPGTMAVVLEVVAVSGTEDFARCGKQGQQRLLRAVSRTYHRDPA